MYQNNPKIKKAQKSLLIIDDFIEDENLIKDIKNEKDFFPKDMGKEARQLKKGNIYHNENAKVFSPWMFWDGWWRSPEDTVKKRLIRAIWEENLPCDKEEVVGFEYWTRSYNPGQYLPVHLDEDTFAYEKNGEFRCPVLGAVYYPSIEVGKEENPGHLEIHPGRVNIDREKQYQLECVDGKMIAFIDNYQDKTKVDSIAYRPNRLVIFDAGMILHGTSPNGENSQRYIVGINVWHKDDPPTGYEQNLFYNE